jgi:hypothetical protein
MAMTISSEGYGMYIHYANNIDRIQIIYGSMQITYVNMLIIYGIAYK